MSADDHRTVRHLRLAAPDADAVRRMLPRIEDALRCASLPGAGARVLLVRRLALGPLAQGLSPQALAGLVERRMAAAQVRWVEGDTAEAADAGFVAFASPFDARLRLSARLLRGAPTGAWYWALAVPEVRTAASAAAAVRAIVSTMAAWAEARVALPAWAAGLLRQGLGPAIERVIAEHEGRALAARLNVHVAEAPREGAGADAPGEPAAWRAAATARGGGVRLSPWLRALARATGDMAPGPDIGAGAGVQPPPRSHAERATDAAPPALADGWRGVAAADAPAADAANPSRDAQAPHGAASRAGPESARHGARPEPGTAVAASPAEPQPRRWTAPPLEGPPHLCATAVGGLLFLLPVLQRLHLETWLGEAEAAPGRFAQAVLRGALARLGVPLDDPLWRLLPAGAHEAGRLPAGPPPWRQPWLAPALARLHGAATLRDQAGAWLDAARRWLRRAEGIGLASLACRPARLSWTATHVDLHFALQDADLRIRRRGLDLDPGWLPWFGRVVAFHYTERQP